MPLAIPTIADEDMPTWWRTQEKLTEARLNPPPPLPPKKKRRRRHSIDAITKVDLDAIAIVQSWGVQEAIVYVQPKRCSRQDCGGSVLSFDGERNCLLCCRGLAVAI